MKRNRIFRGLLQAAVVGVTVASLLCGCSKGPTIVDSSQGCVDKDSGITYVHAPMCYEPVALGEQYGSLKVGDKITYALHEIDGMDRARWLSTEVGDVLYAEGTHLPTLTEMKPVRLRICMDGATVVEVLCMDDAKTVQAVAARYEEGDAVTKPSQSAPVQYTVRFVSEEYPGLYYTLTYLEYASSVEENGVDYGRYFLYDRMSGRLSAVGSAIHNALNGIGDKTGNV